MVCAQLGIVFFACFAISSERLHVKHCPFCYDADHRMADCCRQAVQPAVRGADADRPGPAGVGIVVRLLGGVELGQVIGVIALALVAALSSAAIGLFFSTLLNRAYAVILLSFGTMLFLYAFVPFVIGMIAALSRRGGLPPTGCDTTHNAINPYAMVIPAVGPDAWGRLLGQLPWAWCIGLHLALTAGLMMWSALILRRRARREGEAGGGAGDPNAGIPLAAPVAASSNLRLLAVLRRLQFRFCMRHRFPPGKQSRPARDVVDNPILL